MSKHLRHSNIIYPITTAPVGDDGKRKQFHILRCKNQPPCSAELRINVPSNGGHLPPHAIVKQATQKGWLADRRGYTLCPEHTPWAKRNGEPSDMAPGQKRAAFVAIRERHMDAAVANDRVEDPALERAHDEVLAAARRDSRVKPNEYAVLEALLPAIRRCDFSKGWRGRAAATIPMQETTFSNHVKRLVEHGYVAIIPHSTKLIVRKQTEPEQEVPMTVDTQLHLVPDDFAPTPVQAEAPPQPTVADNRRIREFIDGHYDDGADRWCGDMTDEIAARRLNVPRAWVAGVRDAFYGPDVNEAAEQQTAAAGELMEVAAKLKEDALTLAARAEEIERQARALFGAAR